jgi:cell division protein FtsZ
VHEPAMQGEIRVTVIATGFDKAMQPTLVTPAQTQLPGAPTPSAKSSPVIPFPANRPARVSGANVGIRTTTGEHPRAARPTTPTADKSSQDLSDMEIPTFIRRQMD